VWAEDLELRDHRLADRQAAGDVAEGDMLGLRGGGEIDEDGDEDEERVEEETGEAEQEGEALADGGGKLRRPREADPHGEQRPQYPPAVHGKGGDHVEEDEDDVGPGETREQAHARILEARHVRQVDGGAEDDDQYEGDDDVDRRPRDGDDELFARLFRDALEARDA